MQEGALIKYARRRRKRATLINVLNHKHRTNVGFPTGPESLEDVGVVRGDVSSAGLGLEPFQDVLNRPSSVSTKASVSSAGPWASGWDEGSLVRSAPAPRGLFFVTNLSKNEAGKEHKASLISFIRVSSWPRSLQTVGAASCARVPLLSMCSAGGFGPFDEAKVKGHLSHSGLLLGELQKQRHTRGSYQEMQSSKIKNMVK